MPRLPLATPTRFKPQSHPFPGTNLAQQPRLLQVQKAAQEQL